MSCKPEIVEVRQLTNEFVGYRVVCCKEDCCLLGFCPNIGGTGGGGPINKQPIGPSHTCCTPQAHACESSWHTVSIHREDHESYLEDRKAEVAARHEKMKAWRAKHGK